MSDALAGVREEAIALTKEALVVDIYTTSFGLAIRSLKAGGKPQEPGWFAKPGAAIGAGAFAGRFDLPEGVRGSGGMSSASGLAMPPSLTVHLGGVSLRTTTEPNLPLLY